MVKYYWHFNDLTCKTNITGHDCVFVVPRYFDDFNFESLRGQLPRVLEEADFVLYVHKTPLFRKEQTCPNYSLLTTRDKKRQLKVNQHTVYNRSNPLLGRLYKPGSKETISTHLKETQRYNNISCVYWSSLHNFITPLINFPLFLFRWNWLWFLSRAALAHRSLTASRHSNGSSSHHLKIPVTWP